MNAIVELINAAGRPFVDFVLPMLIQSSALILILLAVDLVLRRRVRAVLRYWVWMLVLVKLVLPPSLGTPVSLGTWFGDELALPTTALFKSAEPAPVNTPAPEPPPGAAHVLSPRVPPFDMPPAPVVSEVWQPPVALPDVRHAPHEEPAPVSPEVHEVPQPALSSAPALTWQGLAVLLWAAVVTVLLLLLMQRAFFVRGLVSQSREADGTLSAVLEECRTRLRLRGPIALRLSPSASTPAVCGLLRPVILVPQDLSPRLQRQELRAVLLHELAHVQRGDLWVNLAQTLLQITYFYNPLLWLANAMIRRTREQAVDETVLVAMGETARQYPEILVNIAKLAFRRRPVLGLRLIGVVESKSALTARIRHILRRPLPKTTGLGLLGLIAVVILAAVLLPMAGAAEESFFVSNKGPLDIRLMGVCPDAGDELYDAGGKKLDVTLPPLGTGDGPWKPDKLRRDFVLRVPDFDGQLLFMPFPPMCPAGTNMRLGGTFGLFDSVDGPGTVVFSSTIRRTYRKSWAGLIMRELPIRKVDLTLQYFHGPRREALCTFTGPFTPGTTMQADEGRPCQLTPAQPQDAWSEAHLTFLFTTRQPFDSDAPVLVYDRQGQRYAVQNRSGNSGSTGANLTYETQAAPWDEIAAITIGEKPHEVAFHNIVVDYPKHPRRTHPAHWDQMAERLNLTGLSPEELARYEFKDAREAIAVLDILRGPDQIQRAVHAVGWRRPPVDFAALDGATREKIRQAALSWLRCASVQVRAYAVELGLTAGLPEFVDPAFTLLDYQHPTYPQQANDVHFRTALGLGRYQANLTEADIERLKEFVRRCDSGHTWQLLFAHCFHTSRRPAISDALWELAQDDRPWLWWPAIKALRERGDRRLRADADLPESMKLRVILASPNEPPDDAVLVPKARALLSGLFTVEMLRMYAANSWDMRTAVAAHLDRKQATAVYMSFLSAALQRSARLQFERDYGSPSRLYEFVSSFIRDINLWYGVNIGRLGVYQPGTANQDAIATRQAFEQAVTEALDWYRAGEPPQPSEPVFEGRVLDASGGGIAGATLTLRQQMTFTDELGRQSQRQVEVGTIRTDADGHFVFRDVANAEYDWLNVTAAGFVARERLSVSRLPDGRYWLSSGHATDNVIIMEKPASLSGRVIGPDGRPLAKVMVHLQSYLTHDHPGGGSPATDEQGRFHTGPIMSGYHLAVVGGRGRDAGPGDYDGGTAFQLVRVEEAQTVENVVLDLRESTACLELEITDADDEPVQAMRVSLEIDLPQEQRNQATILYYRDLPPQRVHRVENLPPLDGHLEVWANERYRQRVPIKLVSDQTTRCRVKFEQSVAELRPFVPPSGPRRERFEVTLPNGVTVQLLGLRDARAADNVWWAPDGSPLPESVHARNLSAYGPPGDTFRLEDTMEREIAYRLTGAADPNQAPAFELDLPGLPRGWAPVTNYRHSLIERDAGAAIRSEHVVLPRQFDKAQVRILFEVPDEDGVWKGRARHTGASFSDIALQPGVETRVVVGYSVPAPTRRLEPSELDEVKRHVSVVAAPLQQSGYYLLPKNSRVTLDDVVHAAQFERDRTADAFLEVIRQVDLGETEAKLIYNRNLKGLLDGRESDIPLEPGDAIVGGYIESTHDEKASAQYQFGDVITAAPEGEDSQRGTFIDLDSGTLHPPPTDLDTRDNAALRAWMTAHSIDARFDSTPAVRGLVGLNMLALKVDDVFWYDAPADLRDRLLMKADAPILLRGDDHPPATYLIKTDEYRMGILQILAPNGMSIQYKLLEHQDSGGGSPPLDRDAGGGVPVEPAARLANGVTVRFMAYSQLTEAGLKWWNSRGEATAVPGVYEADVDGLGTVLAFEVYPPESEVSDVQIYRGPEKERANHIWRLPDSNTWFLALGEQRSFANVEFTTRIVEPPAVELIPLTAEDRGEVVEVGKFGIDKIVDLQAIEYSALLPEAAEMMGLPPGMPVDEETLWSMGIGEPPVIQFTLIKSPGSYPSLVAVQDKDGLTHRLIKLTDNPRAATYTACAWPDQLAAVVVEGSPMRESNVRFRNIALTPGHATTIQVETDPQPQLIWQYSRVSLMLGALVGGLEQYRKDHGSRLPGSLVGMRGYLHDESFYWLTEHVAYIGEGGPPPQDGSSIPVAYDQTLLPQSKGTYVVYAHTDGQYVEFESPKELKELGIPPDGAYIEGARPAESGSGGGTLARSGETTNGSAEGGAKKPFSVYGTVTDRWGRPMAGVEVYVDCGFEKPRRADRAFTDANGRYALEFKPAMYVADADPYGVGIQPASVRARKDGFYETSLHHKGNLALAGKKPAPEEQRFVTSRAGVVLPHEPYELNLTMAPAARLEGTLVDAQDKPLAACMIGLLSRRMYPSNVGFTTVRTDGDGRFTVENAPCTAFQFSCFNTPLGRSGEIAFPHPGTWRLKLKYRQTAQHLAELVVSDLQEPAATAGPRPLGRHALSFDGVDDCLVVPLSPSMTLKPPFFIEVWAKPDFSAVPPHTGRLLDPDEPLPEMSLLRQGREFRGESAPPPVPSVGDANGLDADGWPVVSRPQDRFGLNRIQSGGFMGFLLGRSGGFFAVQEDGRIRQTNIFRSNELSADRPGWSHFYVFQDDGQREYVPAEGPLVVGRIVPRGFPFKGQIAEIRLWNTMLPVNDTRYWGSTLVTGDEPNLVACWTFEEGDGQVVRDISRNGNHAYLGTSAEADAADPRWVSLDASQLVSTVGGEGAVPPPDDVFIPPDANEAWALAPGVVLDGIGQDVEGKVFISCVRDIEPIRNARYRFVLMTKDGQTLEPRYYTSLERAGGRLWEKFSFDRPYRHREIECFRFEVRPGDGEGPGIRSAWDEIHAVATEKPAASQEAPPGRYALYFDGKDDYLFVPDTPSLRVNVPFFVEAWIEPEIEPTENGPDQAFLAKGGYTGTGRVDVRGFGLGLARRKSEPAFLMVDHALGIDKGIVCAPTGHELTPGWMHITGEFTFRDANEVSAPGHPLVVGAFLIPTEHPLKGRLAELRIWDSSADRPSGATPLTGREPGLVACWTFAEGTGQIAYDLSPNANHARLGASVQTDDADPAWVDLRAAQDMPAEVSARVPDASGSPAAGAQVGPGTQDKGVVVHIPRLMPASLSGAAGESAIGTDGFLRAYEASGFEFEAGFVPDKTEYVWGEPMHYFTYVVRNTGDKPLAFVEGGDYRGGRSESHQITAVDAGGRPVPTPDMPGMGGIVGMRKLQPGEVYAKSMPVDRRLAFGGPGVYRVTGRRTLRLSTTVQEAMRQAPVVLPPKPGAMPEEARALDVPTENSFRLTILAHSPERMARLAIDVAGEIAGYGDLAPKAVEFTEPEGLTQANRLYLALETLVSIQEMEALDQLIRLARQGPENLRIAAVQYLGRRTEPRAMTAIMNALNDPQAALRAAAVQAFGTLRTEEAVDVLIGRFGRGEPEMAAPLLKAMGRTRSPRVMDLLSRSLAADDATLRDAAVEGLVAFSSEQAIEILKTCVGDPDMDFRERVVRHLAESLRQPIDARWLVPVVQSRTDADSIGDAPRLMRLYAGERAVPALLSCLDFENPSIRSYYNHTIIDQQSACQGGLRIPWISDLNRGGSAEELEHNRWVLRAIRTWVDHYYAYRLDEETLSQAQYWPEQDKYWGEPVDGIGIRIRCDQRVWPEGMPQVIKIDVRDAKNEGSINLSGPPDVLQVELNGRLYEHRPPLTEPTTGIEGYGTSVHHLVLDDGWRCLTDDQPLRLAPGRYALTVRLSTVPAAERTGLAASRPVRFEVIAVE